MAVSTLDNQIQDQLNNLNSKISNQSIEYNIATMSGCSGWTTTNRNVGCMRFGNIVFIAGYIVFTLSDPSSNYFELNLPIMPDSEKSMLGFVTYSDNSNVNNSYVLQSYSGDGKGIRFQKSGSTITGSQIGTTSTRIEFRLIYLAKE